MAVDPGFREFVLEQLAVVGPVRARAMFGGAGIFSGDVMFALIAYDTLYLKADETLAPNFAAEGSEPFTYEGGGRTTQMSYWRCPERLFEDADEMRLWAGRSLSLALAARKPAKKAKTEAAGQSSKRAAKRGPRKTPGSAD
ncbi:MAG: hypothetical protein GC150_08530 [Rhizobiales bacterium]|nr:hypothetical protein [Hyphomicrobiales bacterium]